MARKTETKGLSLELRVTRLEHRADRSDEQLAAFKVVLEAVAESLRGVAKQIEATKDDIINGHK